jgi:uncharacterized membrane protein
MLTGSQLGRVRCTADASRASSSAGLYGYRETANFACAKMLRVSLSTLLGLIAALAAAGCASQALASGAPGSEEGGPDDCSVNVAASCPVASLSYSSGVGDTLKASCLPCHAAGGVESTVLLTSYKEVSKRLTKVAGQLETCTMPPAGSPPISPSDRQAILDWIVCGAPP